MAKKILLADDSITIQKVVELTFSDGDYQIISASNGAKAIQKLTEFRPDIILSDIIMPEKNGYEVCEYVKSHPDYRDIPVILLTGTFEPFDPDRAEKAGCDAIVTKPFESQSLIQKVDELIRASEARHRQPPPSAEVAPSFTSEQTTAASAPDHAAHADVAGPIETASDDAVFPQSDEPPDAEADLTLPWQIPPLEQEAGIAHSAGAASRTEEESPFLASGWAPETSATDSPSSPSASGLELADPESIDVNAQSGSASTFFEEAEHISTPDGDDAPEQGQQDRQLDHPQLSEETEPFSASEGTGFDSQADSHDQSEPQTAASSWASDEVQDDASPSADDEQEDVSNGRTLPFPRIGTDWQQARDETPEPAEENTTPMDQPASDDGEAAAESPEPWSAETTQWPATAPAEPSLEAAPESLNVPDEDDSPEPEPEQEETGPVPFPAQPTFSSAATVASEEHGWALSGPGSDDTASASAEEAIAQTSPSMDMYSPAEESVPAENEEERAAGLSEDDVERIARRVVSLMSEDLIRNIAWEVVPEMAEMVVKDRIRQLESDE
ncbi:MAG: response regulator [Acidobacteriota bacterium]